VLNFVGYNENLEKSKTFKLAYLEEIEQITALFMYLF